MSINETCLEMYYFRSFIQILKDFLISNGGSFNFYKFSPQKECFVGFDQAFVQSQKSDDELFSDLKHSAMRYGYSLNNFFVGYFLQFKVVKKMKNRSSQSPVKSVPHYRAELSTEKNEKTGFSQHELLFLLNKNDGAMVYYACPMLFDKIMLYDLNPNLDLLRLVDLETCPSEYQDNRKHFIYFPNTDETAAPIWKSDPKDGKAISPASFAKKIKSAVSSDVFGQNQIRLLDILSGGSLEKDTVFKNKDIRASAYEAFTLISYSNFKNLEK